jgi:hypothetical protein
LRSTTNRAYDHKNMGRITGSDRSPPRRDSRGSPARSCHGGHKTALALVVKRLGEDETLVALRRDLRTSLAIAADALGTEIGQKRARFTRVVACA